MTELELTSLLFKLADLGITGIKAAKRYKDKYGFNTILLPMEKDLSDSVKVHGIDKVREVLFPLLKQAL